MIGRTLSHFRITTKLGEGGMGVVYRAEDESLRRPVALKVLASRLVENEEHRLRFLREARAAAAVTHPHVSTIYEIGEADGVVFIAMELVEGRTLRETMGGKALPMKQAVRLACEIAEGLGAAHAAHVIHRDLKPDNIIITKDGRAKVMDFGLAKLLQDAAVDPGEPMSQLETISGELTKAGKVLGTASYMSPEQARGEKVDARSDLFAFGVTLYEMVTGRPPFRGRTATDVLSAIIRDQPAPATQANPEVPAELDRIIGACLEKDPAERYQHADQLVVDLRRLRRTLDSDVQTVSDVRGTGAVARPGRKRALYAIVGATLGALLIAAGFAAWRMFAARPVVNQGDVVLVADFENLTGESRFDTAVRDAFEYSLGNRFLRPARGERLNRLLGIPAGAPRPTVDRIVARDTCARAPCAGYFTGRVRRADGGYSVEAEYWQGRQTPLLEKRSPLTPEPELARAIHQLAADFRRELREPPAGLSIPEVPTTRSLEALQFVALASSMEQLSEWDEILLLTKAQAMDPDWLKPHLHLAGAYNNLGRAREARRWATEVYRRSRTLPVSERWEADRMYLWVTYDHDAVLDVMRAHRRIDPNAADAFNAGSIWLTSEEDPIRAETDLRASLEILPGHMSLYYLAWNLAILGRGAEIPELTEEYMRRGGPEPDALLAKLWAEIGLRNWQSIDAVVGRLAEETGVRRTLSLQLSLMADLSAGRLNSARETTVSLSRAADESRDLFAKYEAATARSWLDMRFDESRAGLPQGSDAPADEDLFWFRFFAAFSVETGLAEPLRSIIAGYEAEFQEPRVRFVREEIQFGRACLSLIEGRAAQARTLLEPLAQSSQFLRRHHVLALVYERLGMWDRAAEEYEAVLKDPPRKWYLGNPAFWALDQFRLAKVSERANRPDKAREWYERFLIDWKEADPGIPEVEEAKKRLVVLGGMPPPVS